MSKKGISTVTLTQKENSLLKDLKGQEQLCIEKYSMYSERAHDPELKQLFGQIRSTEQTHLDTINRIIGGEEVTMPGAPPTAVSAKLECEPSSCSAKRTSLTSLAQVMRTPPSYAPTLIVSHAPSAA